VSTIRLFEPEDMFSVIKLAYETLTERYNPSIFNYFYETNPDKFLVADLHHKLIGFLVAVSVSKKSAKLLMLATREQYRKQGVGSELLTVLFHTLEQQRINKIELEVRTTNIPAIQFYQKHGFSILETISGFYQNGEDAYIMGKSW